MPGSPCQISCAPMPAAAPTLHALPAIIIAGLAPAIHLGAAWTTVTGPVVTTGVKSPRSKTPQPPVDLILSLSKDGVVANRPPLPKSGLDKSRRLS